MNEWIYCWIGLVLGAVICYLVTGNIPAILCTFLVVLIIYTASRKPGVVSFA